MAGVRGLELTGRWQGGSPPSRLVPQQLAAAVASGCRRLCLWHLYVEPVVAQGSLPAARQEDGIKRLGAARVQQLQAAGRARTSLSQRRLGHPRSQVEPAGWVDKHDLKGPAPCLGVGRRGVAGAAGAAGAATLHEEPPAEGLGAGQRNQDGAEEVHGRHGGALHGIEGVVCACGR